MSDNLTNFDRVQFEKCLRRRVMLDQSGSNHPQYLNLSAIAKKYGLPVEFVEQRIREIQGK
jgi:hypothetical protein